jgi:hypothetical protein
MVLVAPRFVHNFSRGKFQNFAEVFVFVALKAAT